jgi:hypothetical protein
MALVVGALAVGYITRTAAQQAPPAGAPAGAPGQPGAAGGRGGGGGFGRGATPVAYDDYTGYTKLWDGQTFKNWEGEMDVWSIENGAIHADTIKTPGQHHIYYTGPGAVMRDFDLKVEVRMSEKGANGGIQYRSRLLHPYHGGSIENPLGKPLPAGVTTLAQAIAAGVTAAPAPRPAPVAPAGGDAAAAGAAPGRAARGGGGGGGAPNPWQVSGYQFDMDSANGFTGQLYEGQGRSIVNPPGGFVILQPGRVSARVGTVIADPAAAVKPHKGLDGEWNQFQIIARGNTLIHMVNGQVITITIDDNPADRAYQGIMSVQLEGSGEIWYRNVYVKSLDKPMEFPKQ